MNKTPYVILSVALLATIAATPHAGATKAPTHPDAVGIVLDLSAPDQATLSVAQTWEGGNARDMRQSLDAYFGLANGMLAPEEVSRIEQASSLDVRNGSLPLLSFDGQGGAISDANVSLVNAVGSVDNMATLSITHKVAATIPAMGAADMRIVLNAPWNGSLLVGVPDGLVVRDAPLTEDGRANVTFAAGRDTVIVIGPAPAPVAPEGGEGVQESREGEEGPAQPAPEAPPLQTPGPSLVVGLAVALVAALLWRRNAGRR